MMTENELIPTDVEVDNIVILVGDAVRWDYSQEILSELGQTYQTIAASHHTPTSFATMLSGVSPTKHGVDGFHQQLPSEYPDIFSLDSHNTAFSNRFINSWLAKEQQIFGEQPQTSLSQISPPFVWVNRHHGGHAPYNGFLDNGDHESLNAKEYFFEYAGDVDRLREDYADSIAAFSNEIETTKGILEERGLAENTLMVITSDHGELLGEHGQIGHDLPGCPELVRVPTTFVHPDLDPYTVETGLMRHIDLVPTLLDVLNIPQDRFEDLDGVSLTERLPKTGQSYYNRSFADIVRTGIPDRISGLASVLPALSPTIRGVWDTDGGHVFNKAARYQLAAIFLLRLGVMPEGRHILRTRSFHQAFRSLFNPHLTYGDPKISTVEARELLDQEGESQRNDDRDEEEFTKAQREQLEDLGYL